MTYKNSEGYPDPTSGKAIKAAGHMPTHIYNASEMKLPVLRALTKTLLYTPIEEFNVYSLGN